MNPLLDDLTEAIKAGKRKHAKAHTQDLIDADVAPRDILRALMAGMDDVGRRFKADELFVPEVLVAARAMQTSMSVLEPALVAGGYQPDHTVVIGTVKGDLHDIGKNLVTMMLKGASYKVVDLGVNVQAESIAAAAAEHGADVIGLSALLTTTMPSMRETVAALRAGGVTAKIIVGGAPVTQHFADDIDADGYAPDATRAVELVRSLTNAA